MEIQDKFYVRICKITGHKIEKLTENTSLSIGRFLFTDEIRLISTQDVPINYLDQDINSLVDVIFKTCYHDFGIVEINIYNLPDQKLNEYIIIIELKDKHCKLKIVDDLGKHIEHNKNTLVINIHKAMEDLTNNMI